MLYFPPESIVFIDEANQAMHNYPAMKNTTVLTRSTKNPSNLHYSSLLFRTNVLLLIHEQLTEQTH